MSEHEARERREARMAEESAVERKDRNNMIALMASVILSGDPGLHPEDAVASARAVLTAAHREEDGAQRSGRRSGDSE